MNQSRFTRLLIKPSTASLLTALVLALLVLFVSGFSYASKNNLLYDYLFGSGSSVTLIESSRSTIAVFNETVFGNPTLNKILFFIFWMAVGLIVYVFLSGVGSGISTAEQTLEQTRFVHAQKLRMGSELGLRVVLRLIALSLLTVFLFLFLKILLPFSLLCARIAAGELGDLMNWLYALLGFIVLVASFHLITILIRFLLLKPRIFGGYEDILQDEIEHKAEDS